LDSALQLDRRDIVECLVARSHGDFRMQALVKQLGQQKRLADAEVIFQACPSPSSAMFAVMIEACGASCELEAARRYGKLASSMGKADVAVRGAMAKVGTKMGQIQAFVEADSKRSLDKISCSLLLKSIQPGVKSCTVEQIMTAVAALEPSDIDEVLLCSAVDSCLRVARADLLFPWLADLQKAGVVECRRVHTFDSMIRAYGSCKNAEGVWRTWKDMRLARVGPSSITVGCMVEALVANGDSDAAYDLCIDLHSEVGGLMNSVILGTLLKGFAHQKRFDRVWAVYQDMLSHHSDLTIVTFNTLIDACARCQEMSRIPQIMLDMEGMHLKPNLITFGTIVKGYVQDGKLDKAHMFVQSIHRSSNFKPDEIMYNTLLDGCAQHRVWERGLAILDEMQAVGITPSNFTISVLLKLARRSNRIDEAHDLCDRLAERYGLTFNVYVYGNMVSAYVDAGYAQKALGVVERMLKAHIQPNQRVYTLLIQGLLNQGELHIAVAVFRAAAGLSQMHAALQEAGGKRTRCQGGLPMDVLSEVLRNLLDAGPQWHECAATLLCDAEAAKLHVQREIKLRIAAMSGTAIGNAACQERPRHHRRR
jgi:pentatricopeptide repeat protein